jgi:oxalate decarboxylase/phosphoglucose isomerase-like protein (cupin superfamily)
MYQVEAFARSRRVLFGSFLFSVLLAVMQFSACATGSVTLAWSPSTDPSVAGYNIYYGGASGTYTNMISVGNATNATISGLDQGTTYYFAATTYTAAGVESSFSSEVSYLVPLNVPTVNQPPTLNAITNLTINENAGLQTVSLSGITSGATNENQTLTVSAVSSNTGLIPNPTVNYTNGNTTGTLTFTPVANGNGTAIITVTVNDNSGASNNIVTQTFMVTVNAVNQPPTLNAITSLTINENAGLQTVTLSGITSGAANESQTLTVSAISSNTGLIPNPTVNYTNGNTTGTLTFTPVANGNGTATITVTVNDGGTSNNIITQTFMVTVNAVNQAPTLDAIGNLSINKNAGLQTVTLSGITSGAANENQVLTVTAVSSTTGLIPNPTVHYTSANSTGSLTFTPVLNKTGTATITVTVKDGGTSNNIVTRTFTVTVATTTTVSRSGRGQIAFSKPLTNCVVLAGQTKTLSVTAAGLGTLKYQWKFNGTNLPSAIRSVLTLSKVTTNQAGTYSVAVSNAAGSTNSTAILTVYATAAATLASTAHAHGQYALIVAGVPGYKYVVQASTNIVNWVPLQTNTAPFTFVDTNANQFNRRYYRSVYLP